VGRGHLNNIIKTKNFFTNNQKNPPKSLTFVGGYKYNIPMNVKTLNHIEAVKVLELKKDVIVYPHAVVNTNRGLATVSFEGVGWFEDKGMYPVLVGDEYNSWMVKLTKEQLLSLVRQEPEMTLHKLIDPHNDRTRSNLWIWENQIKGIDQDVVGSEYNEMKREETNA